jgi:hypothetical protein
MLAAAVALLGSVAAAAAVVAVLQEGAVRAHLEAVVAQALLLLVRAHLAHLPLLEAVVVPVVLGVRAHLVLLAPVPVVVVLPVLLHPLPPLLLPQVVVESEGTLRLQGRQSFSAAMARSSPPTAQPTFERAPSTRSPPKDRTCPSACRNWTRVRG